MKIARTYILTFFVILLMCISGCFDHTVPETTAPTASQQTTGAIPTTGPSLTTAPEETQPPQTTVMPTEPSTGVMVPPTVPPTQPPTEPSTEPTTEPPTEPPTEPKPTYPNFDDEDFVRAVDYVPNLRQELRYGTDNNFTGQKIYDFSDAYLRFGTVKKLAKAALDLEELGLGILIWDGYRPLYAQQKLWDICPDPNYVSQPGTGRQTHCRGIAVDITLYDLETGALLEMPSDFDEFSALGDRDYSDCSDNARENALILQSAMENAGFQPYSGEWWHFADGTDHPIEEDFDPANLPIWVANCNQYITLRRVPGGTGLATILRGESVRLLQWEGKFARVQFGNTVGWVRAEYLKPSEPWIEENLDTVEITAQYTYDELVRDLEALAARYPDLVAADTAGYTDLGTRIPVLRIGDLDAEHHVLMQGAIHGREHATAWLLMAMAETWLEEGGFDNICVHILPMVNPDGVMISQAASLDSTIEWIYRNDRSMGYTRQDMAEYATLWKANGAGVDINRNFPAGWDNLTSRIFPSSQLYRGSSPFSAAEARVLRDYTLRFTFDVTISYHATGSLTYYEYGDHTAVNLQGLELAKAFQQISGYAPTASTGLDAGGYKDWAIAELGIPSLTVEIGCDDAPLQVKELYSVYARNIGMREVLEQFLNEG